MKNYPIWLTGFGCGLVSAGILNLLIYETGIGVAFAFGVLILLIMGARRVFARRERGEEVEW